MHEYSYWVLLIYANKILLVAILDDEIAQPVAMVGGIGAALVILLFVAAGALFVLVIISGVSSTWICVSCVSWGIFYKYLCYLVAGCNFQMYIM
jgi:hypothetical protein